LSDDIQSWMDYKERFSNPHERVERLTVVAERMAEALKLTEKNLSCLVAAKHADEVLMRPWLDEVRKSLGIVIKVS
jgi:hypothetical protein